MYRVIKYIKLCLKLPLPARGMLHIYGEEIWYTHMGLWTKRHWQCCIICIYWHRAVKLCLCLHVFTWSELPRVVCPVRLQRQQGHPSRWARWRPPADPKWGAGRCRIRRTWPGTCTQCLPHPVQRWTGLPPESHSWSLSSRWWSRRSCRPCLCLPRIPSLARVQHQRWWGGCEENKRGYFIQYTQ